MPPEMTPTTRDLRGSAIVKLAEVSEDVLSGLPEENPGKLIVEEIVQAALQKMVAPFNAAATVGSLPDAESTEPPLA